MKKEKLIARLSNLSLAIGAIIGGYALIRILILRSNLPEGVCPINNYRPLMYIAIIFLIISLLLPLFDRKKINEAK